MVNGHKLKTELYTVQYKLQKEKEVLKWKELK